MGFIRSLRSHRSKTSADDSWRFWIFTWGYLFTVAALVLLLGLSSQTVGAAAAMSGMVTGPALLLIATAASRRSCGPRWLHTIAWTVWSGVQSRLNQRRTNAITDAAHHLSNEYQS